MKKITIHIFPIFLGIYSLLIFLLKKNSRTAYDWPALDMATFFQRYFDFSFLKNDFFTNAVMLPNPRHVFGYLVIFLCKIFNCDWYQVFFAMKVLFVGVLPILIFYVLLAAYRNQSDKNDRFDLLAQIVIFLAIILILKNNAVLSIAWWPAVLFVAAPQTLSLFLGFSAILIYSKNSTNFTRFLAIFFFAASTVIHPSVGFLTLVFFVVITWSEISQIKDFIWIFTLGFLLPAIFIMQIFSPKESLSAAEYIKYYVSRHKAHYLVSQFGSLNRHSWIYNFFIINLVIVTTAILAFFKKDRRLLILSSLSLSSYSGCVLVQYLGTEIFQIKAIAMIGFSRYSAFGYWLVVLLLAMSLKNLFPENIIENINLRLAKFFDLRFTTKVLSVIFFLIFVPTIFAADDPFQERDNTITQWIRNNTDRDSIVAANESLNLEIGLIAQRSQIVSGGFPFNESFFAENHQRTQDLYGQGVPFDSLPRDYFVKLIRKYDLQYLVIKTADSDASMKKIVPQFQSGEYAIYSAYPTKHNNQSVILSISEGSRSLR